MCINKIAEMAELMSKNSLKSLEVICGNESYRLERFAGHGTSEVRAPFPEEELAIMSPITGVVYFREDGKGKNINDYPVVIKEGEVLCVIEAMKMHRDVTAEYDLEILEPCFQEGQLIEYGKILFRVKRI